MTLPRKLSATLAADNSAITINGVELHGIIGATIHYEPHVTPTVHLAFTVHEVTAEGTATLEIPGRVAEALIALGWTPPHLGPMRLRSPEFHVELEDDD